MNNIILLTDSYKLNHWNQYPTGTEAVYSYFESRKGAKFDNTVFFGLQYILRRYLSGVVINENEIDFAEEVAAGHFGDKGYFNRAGWEHIINKHDGRLPIRIRAVPEGTPMAISNVLMTVESLDDKCAWLTNALESLLTHVWHPSNVATLSRETKKLLAGYLDETADNRNSLGYMLHDFGFRGCSSVESASIGGAAHLINFFGTDTVPALELLWDYYGRAKFSEIGHSVAATEHSIMTALGQKGESKIVGGLLKKYPKGILSCVADSYDYYNFVNNIVGEQFKNEILKRDGVFVVRPDSTTHLHATPESLVVWTLGNLADNFGSTLNNKGYIVLNPKVRVIWGDGIDFDGIKRILAQAEAAGYSAENLVFGMGGGLLQKHNRDTQRNAFKSSAQKRDGVWYDIQKDPLDKSKASKKGRLKLVLENGVYQTVPESDPRPDQLVTVFENGELTREYTLAEIRANAKL